MACTTEMSTFISDLSELERDDLQDVSILEVGEGTN